MAGETADDQTRHALGNEGWLLTAVNEDYSGYFNEPYPALHRAGDSFAQGR